MAQAWIDGRGLAAFAGGAVLAVLASRLLPPLAAQSYGMARSKAGSDPFDALARDHALVLATLDKMIATPRQATAKRASLLLHVKRSLTAHALAEEDVVYPLLHDEAHAPEEARHLYSEHADIKMHLHTLEQMPKDDPAWTGIARSLRDLVAEHARQEEMVEFPRLRRLLDKQSLARVGGQVSREKAMVL